MSRVRARVHASHNSQTDGELLRQVNHIQRDFILTHNSPDGFQELLDFLVDAVEVRCGLIAAPCTKQKAKSLDFSLLATHVKPASDKAADEHLGDKQAADNVSIIDLSPLAEHIGVGPPQHINCSDSPIDFRIPLLDIGFLKHVYIVPITSDDRLLAVILLGGSDELSHDLQQFEPLFDCCSTLLLATQTSTAEFEDVEGFVLEETVARTAALIDAVPDAILITSRGGQILDFQGTVRRQHSC